MEQVFGFSHFLEQTDTLGKGVLLMLLVLSLASWYVILTKTTGNILAQRRVQQFLERFLNSRSIAEAEKIISDQPMDNPFAELAHHAFEAENHHNPPGVTDFPFAGENNSDFISRVLQNGIEQEAARVEYGLTILGSAGSASPYIGLFGTVWSIYHALVNIGLSGQGTLDKVAGPVGEALIMTALGLAVAIPAVLAYNAFNRRNRLWLAKLEGFAHHLYALITRNKTGSSLAGEGRPSISISMV